MALLLPLDCYNVAEHDAEAPDMPPFDIPLPPGLFFPQVLLRSCALEALLEEACARGSPARDAQPLAQLLGAVAHASVPAGFAVVLADAAASLGQLAAVDPLAPTPAAKRAVCAALGLLKRGIPRPPQVKPAEAPDAKLRRLAGELGRQVRGRPRSARWLPGQLLLGAPVHTMRGRSLAIGRRSSVYLYVQFNCSKPGYNWCIWA